jgi:valyl-tRNA synthetase
MAGIGELHVLPEAKRPRNAGSVAIRGVRIYVHDVSDDEAERIRTTKALAQLDKQIAGKQAKLSDERFLARARAEVVAAERDRLDNLLAERRSLQEHLGELEQ